MGFLRDVAHAVRRGVTRASGAVTSVTAALNGRRALPRVDPPPGQPTSIAQVIEEMRLLGAAMPAEDGVADFHRMYLHVTELVGAAAEARSFQDAAFMERLDCVFAGLYLDACRANDQARSSAWQPLFELRAQPGTASLQYALAGMNAHINFDLGLALVRTCRQLGRTLDSPGVRADFLAINALLAGAVQEVRESYLAGPRSTPTVQHRRCSTSSAAGASRPRATPPGSAPPSSGPCRAARTRTRRTWTPAHPSSDWSPDSCSPRLPSPN